MPTLIQRGENTCYNAVFLVDPHGEIVAEHRQRNVLEGEGWRGQLYFSPGEMPPAVAMIGDRRFGMALGHDLYDPSVVADLVRAGAQLVIVPAHTVDTLHQEQLVALARAAQEIENRHCDGRLVVALEGGYNLLTLPFLFLALVYEIGPLRSLDQLSLQRQLEAIGTTKDAGGTPASAA